VIAIVDAAYGNEASAAACVMAAGWESGAAISEFTHRDGPAADYQPGEFYRRELPLIVSVLAMLPRKPDIVLIDGYVWLGVEGRKGLGAHLHEALNADSAIVGIAKTKSRARAIGQRRCCVGRAKALFLSRRPDWRLKRLSPA
jgi:deoxyribonuclease V